MQRQYTTAMKVRVKIIERAPHSQPMYKNLIADYDEEVECKSFKELHAQLGRFSYGHFLFIHQKDLEIVDEETFNALKDVYGDTSDPDRTVYVKVFYTPPSVSALCDILQKLDELLDMKMREKS